MKPTSVMMATPEQYVEAAFSKCTTTVHSGYFPHEMIHLIQTNFNDIFSIYWVQTFWYTIFKKMTAKEKSH